jgi:hypothetical protein
MIQTKCVGCKFEITETSDDGVLTQIGCSLGRSEKLNPSNEMEEQNGERHFVCSRFCNTYRPEAWIEQLSEEEKSDLKKTVMEEVSPRVGFFIFLDTSSDDALEDLQKTVLSIKNQTNHHPRYVAVIHGQVEYHDGITDILSNHFDHKQTKYHIVQNILREEQALQIDDAFTHAMNGWIFVTTSGEEVPSNLLEKMHKRINIDMRRLVVVEPYENLNGFIFQSALFKFLGGNKPMLEADFNKKISPNSPESKTIEVNTQDFLERVRGIPREDEDTFISWEDFINE